MTVRPGAGPEPVPAVEQSLGSDGRDLVTGLTKAVLTSWATALRTLLVLGGLALVLILGAWLCRLDIHLGPFQVVGR